MASAQVEVWVATHRGTLDGLSRAVDTSLADAALARMMLYRRRAVVAKVIAQFFAKFGQEFRSDWAGRATWAPRDPRDELQAAGQAGEFLARLRGAPPALLFERASIAEAEGRPDDAQADLAAVLADYPGFLAAAMLSARLALASGNPIMALRALATVEREAAHTRQGAALLADAARAVGVHERASRYDLAVLTSLGFYDSRGNDCLPVDLAGEVANDLRMRQIFYVEGRPKTGIVCNSRGGYYRLNSLLAPLLLAYAPEQKVSTFFTLPADGSDPLVLRMADMVGDLKARFQFFVGRRVSLDLTLRRSRNVWAAISRFSRLILSVVLGGIIYGVQRLVLALGRGYRQLPEPIRARAHRYRRLPQPLRERMHESLRSWAIWLVQKVQTIFPGAREELFSQISDRAALSRITSNRYQAGLAEIFGLPILAPTDKRSSTEIGRAGRAAAAADEVVVSSDEGTLLMPPSGRLPPAAEAALRSLTNAAGVAGEMAADASNSARSHSMACSGANASAQG